MYNANENRLSWMVMQGQYVYAWAFQYSDYKFTHNRSTTMNINSLRGGKSPKQTLLVPVKASKG